jgi:phosphoribosylamine---glycine ligase
VLKADGLAAGKGVWIARDWTELDAALAARAALGEAGAQALVEEHLEGVELTVLAFTDGEAVALMPPARDYKRVSDGDTGRNTGGMGGYTWPTYATRDLLAEIESRILQPTLAGMAAEGHPYRGVLYCGLMLTAHGPRVLEFNARFGDPEAQLILPLLESSLLDVCLAVCDGRMGQAFPRWRNAVTCAVVLAAPGYPEHPRLGAPISGLDTLPQEVLAFHAGTRQSDDGLVTSGGRVVALVGQGESLAAARQRVYAAAPLVNFDGVHYRRDIGLDIAVAV